MAREEYRKTEGVEEKSGSSITTILDNLSKVTTPTFLP